MIIVIYSFDFVHGINLEIVGPTPPSLTIHQLKSITHKLACDYDVIYSQHKRQQ